MDGSQRVERSSWTQRIPEPVKFATPMVLGYLGGYLLASTVTQSLAARKWAMWAGMSGGLIYNLFARRIAAPTNTRPADPLPPPKMVTAELWEKEKREVLEALGNNRTSSCGGYEGYGEEVLGYGKEVGKVLRLLSDYEEVKEERFTVSLAFFRDRTIPSLYQTCYLDLRGIRRDRVEDVVAPLVQKSESLFTVSVDMDSLTWIVPLLPANFLSHLIVDVSQSDDPIPALQQSLGAASRFRVLTLCFSEQHQSMVEQRFAFWSTLEGYLPELCRLNLHFGPVQGPCLGKEVTHPSLTHCRGHWLEGGPQEYNIRVHQTQGQTIEETFFKQIDAYLDAAERGYITTLQPFIGYMGNAKSTRELFTANPLTLDPLVGEQLLGLVFQQLQEPHARVQSVFVRGFGLFRDAHQIDRFLNCLKPNVQQVYIEPTDCFYNPNITDRGYGYAWSCSPEAIRKLVEQNPKLSKLKLSAVDRLCAYGCLQESAYERIITGDFFQQIARASGGQLRRLKLWMSSSSTLHETQRLTNLPLGGIAQLIEKNVSLESIYLDLPRAIASASDLQAVADALTSKYIKLKVRVAGEEGFLIDIKSLSIADKRQEVTDKLLSLAKPSSAESSAPSEPL